MRLILATNNQNKLREVQQMLSETNIEVLSPNAIGISVEVEETGATFAENAMLKARAVQAAAIANGHACSVLADDSGLAVDALDGAPGVYSHRFAGEQATDEMRCEKLLSLLGDRPATERTARFVCAMCLLAPDGTASCFTGTVEGCIGTAMQGANGFGYDPIFLYGTRSFAELSAAEKNAVSHRQNALKQVVQALQAIQTRAERSSAT